MLGPLHLGVAWHPELCPEDTWPDDVARMKELGLTVVRLFEYAWHRFEPREWEFEFEWGRRVLDLLNDNGLKAIVATPTAMPPAWMSARHPEILLTRVDGRRAVHGQGRVHSPCSSRYREFCSRIADQIVHAYRGHDAIVGWQLDHEMHGADFGPEARRTFHAWLQDRFGHVDQLNTVWGAEQQSQAFEYFEQVPVPAIDFFNNIKTNIPTHPSLALAFQRFINDQWSSFIQTQVEPIRGGFETKLAINMTPNLGMNWFRQNHLIDRVALSASTIDLAADLLPHFDRMRAEKTGEPFWLTDAPSDRTAAWLAALCGGELVLLRNWREHWAGADMGKGGLLSATGRFTAAKGEVARTAKEFADHAQWLTDHPPLESRIAVVMSNESAWAFSIDPPSPDFDYWQTWRDHFYAPIARTHYWRDVIDQSADFCPYYVMVMPMLPIVFRPTKDRLREWVQSGGCLLLGPLSAHRTEEFTVPTDHEFTGVEDLIGASAFKTQNVQLASSSATPLQDSFAFEPTTAEILERYSSGEPAIISHKLGQGLVITLGCFIPESLYLQLFQTLCKHAKVEPLATGSPHVAVIPRMNPDTSIAAYAVVNLGDTDQMITLPVPGRDRLSATETRSEVRLAPREVRIVELSPKPDPAQAQEIQVAT